MLTTTFNLKDKKAKLTPAYLIIRWSGQRIAFPTGEKIDPKSWITDSNSRNYNTIKASAPPELKQKLSNIDNRAKNVFRIFENDQGREPEKDEFRRLLDLEFGRIKQEGFFEQYDNWMNHSSLIGRNKPATTLKYKQSKKILEEFDPQITFNKITASYFDKFIAHLFNTGYSPNTVGKHCRSLKAFLNYASGRGYYVHGAALRLMQVPREDTDKLHLDIDQVKDLINLKINNKPLDQARDLFIFSCFTALRVSDLMKVDKRNIKKGYLEIRQTKTGDLVQIPIHPVITDLLKKYKGDIPPRMVEKYYNRQIKEVAKMCDSTAAVADRISSHTGRRTFCSMAIEENWFDSVTQIMRITGHAKESSFWVYVGSKPKMNISALQDKMSDSWK